MIWKCLTLVFATTSILLVLLQFKHFQRDEMLSEPRLLGTWVSDKERTRAHFPEHMTEAQKDKLASMFGKLRVTFSPTECLTELDGHTEAVPYTVLGVDKHSVVIRVDSAPNPELDLLEMSTFSKIHFDGPDSYWVVTEIGGISEYFRRVTDNMK